jgi:hypothetical protein
MDAPSNPTLSAKRETPLLGRFAFLTKRMVWTNHPDSTNSSGTNSDAESGPERNEG